MIHGIVDDYNPERIPPASIQNRNIDQDQSNLTAIMEDLALIDSEDELNAVINSSAPSYYEQNHFELFHGILQKMLNSSSCDDRYEIDILER